MRAQINIKSEEAYAIASELAAKAGVSLTQAVLDALRARKRELSKAEKLKEVMALCRDTASRMSPAALALDHGDFLYDDDGLPK